MVKNEYSVSGTVLVPSTEFKSVPLPWLRDLGIQNPQVAHLNSSGCDRLLSGKAFGNPLNHPAEILGCRLL